MSDDGLSNIDREREETAPSVVNNINVQAPPAELNDAVERARAAFGANPVATRVFAMVDYLLSDWLHVMGFVCVMVVFYSFMVSPAFGLPSPSLQSLKDVFIPLIAIIATGGTVKRFSPHSQGA